MDNTCAIFCAIVYYIQAFLIEKIQKLYFLVIAYLYYYIAKFYYSRNNTFDQIISGIILYIY